MPPNAGGAGLIPGQGGKIPHASRPKSHNIRQKQYRNKFKKDFFKWPIKKKIDYHLIFNSVRTVPALLLPGA